MPSSRSVPLYPFRPRNPPVSNSLRVCLSSSHKRTLRKATRQVIRGRLYGFGSNKPRSVGVKLTHFPTGAGTRPFVVAEELLGTALFIHDCSVKFSGGIFKIYFTRHRYLPANTALLSANPQVPWHGQILVVRMSSTRHVNLRRGDLALIQKVTSRYVKPC